MVGDRLCIWENNHFLAKGGLSKSSLYVIYI